MNVLKIKDDDILWKYYQKSYTLLDQQVPPPVNLCSYFWTAVSGRVQSFYMEASLFLVTFITVVGLAGCVSFIYILPNEADHIGQPWLFASVVLVLITGFAALMQALGWIISFGSRLTGRVKTVFTIGLFSVGAALIIWNITMACWEPWDASWSEILTGLCIAIVVVLVMGATLVGLVAAITFIMKPMASWRLVQTVWAYIKAVKHRMCPLMESPDSFKESQNPE